MLCGVLAYRIDACFVLVMWVDRSSVRDIRCATFPTALLLRRMCTPFFASQPRLPTAASSAHTTHARLTSSQCTVSSGSHSSVGGQCTIVPSPLLPYRPRNSNCPTSTQLNPPRLVQPANQPTNQPTVSFNSGEHNMSSVLQTLGNAMDKAGKKIDDVAHNLLDPQHTGLHSAAKTTPTAEQGQHTATTDNSSRTQPQSVAPAHSTVPR